jgi:hypothetical protein
MCDCDDCVPIDEVEALVEELVEEKLADERAEREALREQVDENSEQIEAQQEQLDELEDETDNVREDAARDRAKIRRRIHDVEETLADTDFSDANPGTNVEKPASIDQHLPETSLEQVVAFPEQLADEQLTINGKRARFIASDVRDYAQSVPAGWSISSSTLRQVLKAAYGSGHTQTASRVMEILDNFGGEEVQIVERRGTKRVVFSDKLVNRLDRCGQDADHTVVMAQG